MSWLQNRLSSPYLDSFSEHSETMLYQMSLNLFPDIQSFASARIAQQPPERLAFFTGLNKVSKEKTTPAAGMTVRLFGVLIR